MVELYNVRAQVCRTMAQTLSFAAVFTALLAASRLGSVSAGVRFETGLQYPGITGTIPACAPTRDDLDRPSVMCQTCSCAPEALCCVIFLLCAQGVHGRRQ